jgi:hypothetical protein
MKGRKGGKESRKRGRGVMRSEREVGKD